MAKEKYYSPKEVAEIMGISVGAARVRMLDMPGCSNVGSSKNYMVLRVPESGLEAWQGNRTIQISRNSGKIARRMT